MKKIKILFCGIGMFSMLTTTSCKFIPEDFVIGYNYELNDDGESYTLNFEKEIKKEESLTTDITKEEGLLSFDIEELNIPTLHLNYPVTKIIAFDKYTDFDGIGSARLKNYSKLKEVIFPELVKEIEGDFFRGLNLNTNDYNTEKYIKTESNDYFYLLESKATSNVTIHSDCNIIGTRAFYKLSIDSVTFSENLTQISNNAFVDCRIENDITLPNSLLGIGDYAFYSTYMESINIPLNVEKIGKNPFTIKESITIDSNNPYFLPIENMIYEKKTKKLIQLNGDVLIPDDCLIIGKNALENKTIEDLTIPFGVKNIESNTIHAVIVRIPSTIEMADEVDFLETKDVYYEGTEKNFKRVFKKLFADNYHPLDELTIHCSDGNIDIKRQKD